MKPLDPRLVRRSRSVRRHLALSVALGTVTAAVVVVQAMVLSRLVADRFDGRAVPALAVAVALSLVVRALVGWAQGVAATAAAVRVKTELRTEIVEDLLDPRRVGPRPDAGSVVTLLGPGLDAFDGYVGRFLPQVALSVLVPGVVVGVIAWNDLLAGAVVGLTLPLVVVFMVLVGLLTRDRVDRRWRALERLGRHFADVLDGLVVLKVFGRRTAVGLREVGERHRRASVRALRLAFLSSFVLELFSTLAVALVAVSVGLRVVRGGLPLDAALLVLLLAPEAFTPLRRLGALFHDSADGAEAVGRALEVLDHPRHTGTGAVPDLRTGEIVLRDVVVRHAGRDTDALVVREEVLRPGEVVAVTGPSGAGKSTLLAVLLGWQLPSGGVVQVDGVDLATIDPARWRACIAWVPQVPGLVRGTVADNVRLGCAGDTDVDAVRSALAAAGASDLSPDRSVAEGGLDLSAGERRRVAVARALLRVRSGGAQVLLLDEPTAGLDADREDEVLAAVLDVTREHGVTAVVVTHRPRAIAAADRRVVLGAGAPRVGVGA
jgi:thiol reductant ABC exporter CydD subunit